MNRSFLTLSRWFLAGTPLGTIPSHTSIHTGRFKDEERVSFF